MTAMYDASKLEQVAINLFHGWGYNFYRVENQLRADDLKVRAEVSLLLGQARASLAEAESAFRRQHLPPPSREAPRPDQQAVTQAQILEHLGSRIGSLESRIRAQPAPENDRMTQRYREERATLKRLVEIDTTLVGHADFLRQTVAGQTASELLENLALIESGLTSISGILEQRQNLLA